MKQIEVGKLYQGDAFSVAGRKYTVLDRIGNGAFVIDNDPLKDMRFGETNDFAVSDVSVYLSEKYLSDFVLKMSGRHPAIFTIDLKAPDGSREYGTVDCRGGLLTLEQYIKYAEYIPLVDRECWLATPVGTPNGRVPYIENDVWFVNSAGRICWVSCGAVFLAPRPVLMFDKSLMVSVEGETDQRLSEFIRQFRGLLDDLDELGQ